MTEARGQRRWLYMGLIAVGAVVLYAAPMLLLKHRGAFGLDATTRLWIRTLCATAVMAWTTVFAVLMFRDYDEFHREGSKFAWYWGASVGIAASAPVFVFVALGGLQLTGLQPALAPPVAKLAFNSFVTGYTVPLLFEGLGFAVARAWWRWAKR